MSDSPSCRRRVVDSRNVARPGALEAAWPCPWRLEQHYRAAPPTHKSGAHWRHGGDPMRISHDMGVLVVAALLLCGLGPGVGWGQSLSPDQAIQRSQHLLQRNPRDARAYYRLGDAYIQKAREGGDLTYLTLAEQALRTALDLAPRFSGAARHLAYVFYYRHAFAEAATQAAQAIELDPGDSHAYGILGDAYLEVGKYEQARQAYQQMMQRQGDLYAYSRVAGLKSLTGDADGAWG